MKRKEREHLCVKLQERQREAEKIARETKRAIRRRANHSATTTFMRVGQDSFLGWVRGKNRVAQNSG